MTRATIFGATGRAGSAIVSELAADCEVVAGVRRPNDATRLPATERGVGIARIDIDDPASVRAAVDGSTVIVNAVRLRGDIAETAVLDLHRRIMQAVAKSGRQRSSHVVIVGGAGAVRLSDGSHFWESPGFPTAPLPRGRAHAVLREYLEDGDHDYHWSYLVPPARFHPDGPRSKRFAKWRGQADESAFLQAEISYADFAVAVRDAVLRPSYGVWLVGQPVGELHQPTSMV